MHCVGLIHNESPHYLDHLAPFCAFMRWPLIICEPSLAEKGRAHYPDLEVIETSLWNLSFSSPVVACEPRALLRIALPHAPMGKTLWLPHGNSDKGWKGPSFEALEEGEIALVYGQKMLHFLQAKKVPALPIRVGNFRWAYFQKHRSFFETLVKQEIASLPSGNKNFLYAPTWEDGENNGSFWRAFPLLAKNLPDSCNLIVKWHPNTYRRHMAALEALKGNYKKKKNLLFLTDFCPIYPLLNACDAYIGDMSSLGYDFLKFDRPLFFLNMDQRDSRTDPSLYLYRCGTEIFSDQIPLLFTMSEQEDQFSKIRRETYNYVFDPVLLKNNDLC